MTEQYLQRNINDPEGSLEFSSTALEPVIDLDISAVGKLVLVDTSAANGTLTLPSARESGGGATITVVAQTASVNGLLLAPAAGDVLVVPVGPPVIVTNPISGTDNSSVTCQSDGDSTWYIVDGLI